MLMTMSGEELEKNHSQMAQLKGKISRELEKVLQVQSLHPFLCRLCYRCVELVNQNRDNIKIGEKVGFISYFFISLFLYFFISLFLYFFVSLFIFPLILLFPGLY